MENSFIYPEHLKSENTVLYWSVKSVIVIVALIIFAVLIWKFTGKLTGGIFAGLYVILTMRIDDMSIMKYITLATRFLITKQQFFEWKKGV